MMIETRDATRGGVNAPASPAQRGQESPLSIDAIQMDVPRNGHKARRRRIAIIAGALTVLGVTTLGIRWASHRAPAVARDQLWIATVEHSPLTMAVRGQGTLVPTELRWASAPVAARVDKLNVEPGVAVEPETVLFELANPDTELAALTADRDVAQAEAQLAQLSAQLDGARLAQESAVAGLDGDTQIAQRRGSIDHEMAAKGVIADLESLESADRAKQLAGRLGFETRRLAALRRGNTAQLTAQRGQLEQLRALAAFRHRQLDALHVRAGRAGVVQQIAVEVGQAVAAGAPLARIIVPDHLQARLKIPEASVTDVALGLSATIDTRTGVVPGQVVRIDPAAHEGSVTIDVKLTAPLPKAARVDQTVDGVIDLAKTGDVLHVARPAVGEAHQTVGLFVLSSDGEARRVSVTFGRASLHDIEIASGLSAGDRVVLSDMTRWDGTDRLRIQ